MRSECGQITTNNGQAGRVIIVVGLAVCSYKKLHVGTDSASLKLDVLHKKGVSAAAFGLTD